MSMSQQHNCPCKIGCALQSALQSIGGKWKLPVLCSLTANGDSRYNELLRSVQGISNDILEDLIRWNMERESMP